MSGNRSPSFGPILVKSLGGSGMRTLSLSNRDHLPVDADGGVPGDCDRILHALVRRTALRMEMERTFGGLACVNRHRQVVVDVNGLDPDSLADPGNPSVDRGREPVAIEYDFAPCQGASQGAVHSACDG